MPNFLINQLVPAGGLVANALAGSAFEFLARDSKVAMALAFDRDALVPATSTVGDILATIQFGAEVQLEAGEVPIEEFIGGGAKIPDNVQVDDVGAAGDRLVVRLENTDAVNPHRVRGVVRILPL